MGLESEAAPLGERAPAVPNSEAGAATGAEALGMIGPLLLGGLLGFLWLTAALRSGLTPYAAVYLPPLLLVAAAGVVDLRRNLIPNWITVPGLAWQFAGSLWLAPRLAAETLLGALACGGVLLVAALVSRGGIGGGDVKLAALLGASLGWGWGLVALGLAHLAGALLAGLLVLTHRRRRRNSLPMGPFLAAFALLAHLAKPI